MTTVYRCGGYLVLGALAACASRYGGHTVGEPVNVVVYDAQGDRVALAQLTQTDTGVRIVLGARRLSAGRHGLHIHAVGKCEGPDFMSAGPHFNPAGKQHGTLNPAGSHAGDLPNILVDLNGDAELDVTLKNLRLYDGPNPLVSESGTSLVIHAEPDDEMTDPSGNSGARIACGVILPESP